MKAFSEILNEGQVVKEDAATDKLYDLIDRWGIRNVLSSLSDCVGYEAEEEENLSKYEKWEKAGDALDSLSQKAPRHGSGSEGLTDQLATLCGSNGVYNIIDQTQDYCDEMGTDAATEGNTNDERMWDTLHGGLARILAMIPRN